MLRTQTRSGHGRGKTLGFPTLNLEIPSDLHAEPGIYAGWVMVDHQSYPAAFHYGPIPTFGENGLALEAYLIDVTLKEKPPEVSFELAEYIRPVKTFSNAEELSEQIARDVAQVRLVLDLPAP